MTAHGPVTPLAEVSRSGVAFVCLACRRPVERHGSGWRHALADVVQDHARRLELEAPAR